MRKYLRLSNFLLIAIFVFTFLLLIGSARSNSATTDEAVHLFSGYTYLTERDFRLDPEHPPLLKELAAMPLLFISDIRLSLDELWEKAGNFDYDSWREARALAENFLFSSGNDADRLIFWGRFPFIILTLLLGLAVYWWARKLYGENAGVFAAFLILLLSSVLAHGHLINTDLGLTFFLFLAVYFWTKFLKTPNWINFVLSGLFLGFTLASKFTGIIGLIILIILVLAKIFYCDKNLKLLLKYLGGFTGILIIGLVVAWAAYGFSTSAPAEFFKGLSLVKQHALGGHGSFLLGQLSSTGWWYYFPVAIWYKTPLAFFIFLILALYEGLKPKIDTPGVSKNRFDEIALLAPPVIFLAVSMFSKADLGIRHVLPIFPFLAVYAAKSINLVKFKFGIWNLLFGVLIVWYLWSSISVYPNYLTYFNEAAGGPDKGYKILVDSNLDWGQDYYRIKKYLDEHQITDGYILYPWDGNEALNYYGINLKQFPWGDRNIRGFVVISATYYQLAELQWLDAFPREQITPGVFIFDVGEKLYLFRAIDSNL